MKIPVASRGRTAERAGAPIKTRRTEERRMNKLQKALVLDAGLPEDLAGKLMAVYGECVDMEPEEPPPVRMWREEITRGLVERMVQNGEIPQERVNPRSQA